MEKQNGALNGLLYSIFAFVLFLTFMILKLCNVINWSWWWVTAPLWAGAAIGVVLIIIGLILIGIAKLIERIEINRAIRKIKKQN